MSEESAQASVRHLSDGIRALTPSEEDLTELHNLWMAIFPSWPVSLEFFRAWLFALPGYNHHLHKSGFCLSFLSSDGNAQIAAVGVLASERRHGLGTGLLKSSKKGLLALAKESGIELKSLKMGSQTPRFWPQVPKSITSEVEGWLSKASFRASGGATVRDFFKDIRTSIAPPDALAKAAKTGYRFTPWSPELYEETMAKQTALFSWAAAYGALHEYGQHDQVLVAFDPVTNDQVGWTLMCSPSAIISQTFAFRTLCPTRDKTGLIAAVGVDESTRGKGVGLALMVKAMENMRGRGVDGVFVDSTVLTGFYEQLSFETLFEYDGYECEL